MSRSQNERYIDDLVKKVSRKGDPYEIIAAEIGLEVLEYRRKWALTGNCEKVLPFPLHLNIELVYGCNLRCKFCMFSTPRSEWTYKARPGDKIEYAKYKEIIDEGIEKGLCSVELNGYNEPLIQSDITKYVAYARKAGVVDVSLHTNGLLLNDNMSRELIDAGLTMMMFSIDAAKEESYKLIRGGDFKKVQQNVLNFIEIRNVAGKTLPLVRVSFVENRVNTDELEDFISFWKDKADYFAIQSFSNPFVGKDNHETVEEMYRFKDTPFISCAEPYQRMMIMCDGSVAPCCSAYGLEKIVGNIYESSISEIWASKKMELVRKTVNAKGKEQSLACRKCRLSVVSPLKDAKQ